ncbi:MAG: trehalose-6-phosphate synthase [Deltaproteobacteria bacterium]|nr:trehalose-6-phosphate synthase [Deltaproteobacteria bacterium]
MAMNKFSIGSNLDTARLILVANRLPINVVVDGEGGLEVKDSVGGVATALKVCWPVERRAWVGWPGDLSKLSEDDVEVVNKECGKRGLVPLPLSAEELESYYEGCSNAVLWPVFHNRIDRVPVDSHFDSYRSVNARFADAVIDVLDADDDDIVWVHDFHLCLVPGMLRRARPTLRVAFFLHIPFPPPEIFSILPERRELLEGLLGSDIVGFHTARYRDRFLDCVRALVPGVRVEDDCVIYDGRRVEACVAPLGVDADDFSGPGDPEIDADMAELRAPSGRADGGVDIQVLLGVDRLDYTKGIPRRLLAVERLLEMRPELHGRFTLVQIAVPSREKVEAYAELKLEVQQLVGRVNGKHSSLAGAVPIRLLSHGFTQTQLLSLYRAADVMVVTPLLDGMNLVAKEFVAARTDDAGVLVLSEFAGAAAELKDALIVNPYDIDGTARALGEAIDMAAEERRDRMRRLRLHVVGESPRAWAEGFLKQLVRVPPAASIQLEAGDAI